MRSALVALAVFVVVACSPPALRPSAIVLRGRTYVPQVEIDPVAMRRRVDSLRALDPVADAFWAATRSDLRFWALEGGMDLQPPRVPGFATLAEQRRLAEWRGVRVFPLTGAESAILQPGDSSYILWQYATLDYALRYNLALAALRPVRRPPPRTAPVPPPRSVFGRGT